MLHDHEEAHDLTQETFINAYRHLPKFKMHARFYTWIYRIAVNLCINFIKKKKNIQTRPLTNFIYSKGGQPYFEKVKRVVLPESPEFKEIEEALHHGLQTLSPRHKAVLIMYDIEGLSHKEIAQLLHINEGTVRSRLHYARQKMRKFLKDFV
jgi:RNA polymerase sigma-70 factor (ECF subfamily)